MPASSARSLSAEMSRPTLQSRTARFWRAPASRSSSPLGSPTTKVPMRCALAWVTTSRAAS